MDNEGEKERGDVGVVEESVVGSNELKNLEGDEVFEEAIDPSKHFDNQGDNDVDVAATVSSLPSDSVDEIGDNVEELDNFQESVGVVDEFVERLNEEEDEVIDNQEESVDQQVKLYSAFLDGTEETEDGVSCEESNGIKDDCSGGKELADFNTDGSTVFQEGRDLVNGNLGLSSEEIENEDVEFVTPRQNGGMVLENGSTDKVGYAVDELHTEFGSDEEMRNQGAEAGYLKESGLDPDVGDDKIEEQFNASGDPSNEIQDDTGEKAHRHSTHEDLEPRHEIFTEVEDETIDTDIIHKDTNGKETGISDSQSTDGKVYGNDETEDDDAGSNSEHLETIGEIVGSSLAVDERKVIETSGISSLSENSFANETPTVQATAAYSEEGGTKVYQSQISNDENHENLSVVERREVIETGKSFPALDERKVTETVGSSFPSENSFANETPSVQATAADSEEGSTKVYLSQISNEENQGDNEKSSVVVEPEKIPENNVKEKQTTQITKELNSELDSSSGKSVATSTPLVRPVGLGPAAPLLEPAPRVAQQPRVNYTVSNSQSQRMEDSSSGEPEATSTPPVRPVGLGPAAPLLEPAPRVVQQPRVNYTVSNAQSQRMEDSSSGEPEENDETRERLQMIRVKFLRLANRFGQTPHNVVVAQVLYRLGLAEQLRGRNGGRVGAFSFDRASAMAEQLESAGQEPLDFSCTIMVLGKSGVGKSSTINSIFDEVKFNTDAFHMGTKKVQDVVGTVQGIKVRVIDTPGLLPSWSDQPHNEKILHSVKRFIKKTPPDIVLYLDRLDMQSRDFSDMPLLRTITDIFGPPIWFNAIVVLTHAASAPPDGPNGTPSTYDMFVTQRSHVVQQAIRQAAGDMRLMNPVSLVENHSACRTNTAGQRVLPNGQVWKPQLLLLSFASKILAEANALLKLQDNPREKPYTARARAPPLPFLLSSLLQSRPQLKLPEDQFSDEDSLNDDLDEPSDSGDETDPDDLPPFKPLTKAQIRNLSRAQKKAYLDEVEYREKLFMKKQLKYEKKQRKMMKEMAESVKDLPSDYVENVEEESGGAASVPVPMPDMSLPASFDSDTPTHRYRHLDSSNQWLVRPVLETHGWDHDVGYEGLNVERLFVLKDKIPVSFSGQVTKDKKDANVQMEMTSSVKYGEGKATSLGFDMQTVGKDLAYTLRSETKFCNFLRNKATAGLSFTLLGDALSAGVKVEDKLIANKRFKLVIAGGAMTGRDDVAYGGSLEAQLRDKNYPLGRSLSTLGLSVMDWHGDLAVGCNLQSQIPIGRYTNLVARANLNNRGAGQISIRLNSSEQLQIALIGLIPLLKKVIGYSQQLQFGQDY